MRVVILIETLLEEVKSFVYFDLSGNIANGFTMPSSVSQKKFHWTITFILINGFEAAWKFYSLESL